MSTATATADNPRLLAALDYAARGIPVFPVHHPIDNEKEQPPRYTPKRIAHPATIDERITSLEHDVGIIAQIVMGVRHAE